MTILLKGGRIFLGRKFVTADVLLKGGSAFVFDEGFAPDDAFSQGIVTPDVISGAASAMRTADEVIDLSGKDILPGFADVHVHFREPGFSYKETIRSGSLAAAAGGYTCVCPMPNIVPVPKDLDSLGAELDIINKTTTADAAPYSSDAAEHDRSMSSDSPEHGRSMSSDSLEHCRSMSSDAPYAIPYIDAIPYGAITVKQDGRSSLSNMESMAPYVCAFSDDGRGVQTGALMRDAMELARSLNKAIVAHCEDESLLQPGGCVHEGPFAEAAGLVGISSASEWRQVERDVNLCYETGCAYHVCHVSTKESVQIIREAKASGVDVTCETAPHYLALTQDDLAEYCANGAVQSGSAAYSENGGAADLGGFAAYSGFSEPADSGRFKMNPPLRGADDREALREGVFDGTIDMIATDHAPHSTEEKARGLEKSPFGIVGLETAFPVLMTRLADTGLLTYERLIECITSAPRKRFGLPGAEMLDRGSFRPVFSETVGGGCEGNVGYKEAMRGERMIFPDLTVVDPDFEYTIDPEKFLSMGRATPFAGDTVRGKIVMTVHGGEIIYRC